MCEDCREIAAGHIMDYVNLGLTLPVAVRLERDAVVQQALRDRAIEDALQMALDVSDTVQEVGEMLEALVDHDPDAWEMCLTVRRMTMAAEEQS